MNQLKIEEESFPLTSNLSSNLNRSINECHKSAANTFLSSNVIESFDQDKQTIKSDNKKDRIHITKPRSRDPRH